MSAPAAAAGAGEADEIGRSPLRWAALGLAALAIFASYYESDAIGPIADLLLRQRGFTQSQIGDLTAVISLPNIPLAVINGVLIDRYGPARITLWAAIIGLAGAVLTAVGSPYELMWSGRLIFGVSEGAIFISLVAGLAQWFARSGVALATALFLSLARVGSFSLDVSPTWARSLYEAGWQPPLWLGAAITLVGLVAALALYLIEPWRRRTVPKRSARPEVLDWSALLRFDLSYWYILGLHVLYAAVFFPFRQTYAIEYFQHVKGLTLQQAGSVNSGVFAAAIFATPLFGLLADRFGHRALMLSFGTLLLPVTFAVLGLTDLSPWISTVLMGVSFALVPAIIWPATTLIVEPRRLGTALGVITLLQNLGLWGSNRLAGWLADRAGAGPAHPQGYAVMLWFFGLLSLTALTSALLLWGRESSPRGHGLELARSAARLG
ncbi:MAG TPA: MFS transporter [Steroidobacteraceae bacterium]|nr:MFS transporter [Steroidobacteraceae bacterium]